MLVFDVAIELEVYIRDPSGTRYRVHDVAFGPPLAAPGTRKRLALGDPRARYRIFVPADRTAMLRVFDFRKAEEADRALTAAVLEAQFGSAAYAPINPTVPAPTPPGTKLGQ